MKDDTKRYGNKGSGKATQCYIGWAEHNGAKVPIEIWSPEDTELLNVAGYETDWKHGAEYTLYIPVEVADRKGKWRIARVQSNHADEWVTHQDAQEKLHPVSTIKTVTLRGDEILPGDILHERYEVTGKLPQHFRVRVLEVGKRTLKVEYLDADLRHQIGDVIEHPYSSAFTYTVERIEKATSGANNPPV